ncbi:N-acetyltransferase family protein [Pseudaestuariivita sp.]|uniref:N-acetyltransferase family protein n=1 Tax=Pseudaestuariivita sp. TaxID=2211669 RepID=UPI004057FA71
MTASRTGFVRALTREDRGAWVDLWTQYLAFYDTAVPASVYDSTFDRLLGEDPRDFNAMVYEHDGAVVGLVHYLFHRHCWKVEDTCYLQDLFVAPDARGLGAGRALIQAVYQAGDAAGAPSVYWLTQDFNETARTLYDRVGALTPFIKYQRA